MKLIGRILLAAIAYVFGIVVMGMVAGPLHIPTPEMPQGMTVQQALVGMLLATVLLTASLTPLASGLTGSWAKRWGAVAGLLFITLGLNQILELLIFSTLLKHGNALASLQYLLPAVLAGAVLALPSGQRTEPPTAQWNFGIAGSVWRLAVAWLAFPVIYLFFGMMVAPIVVPYYNAGVAGLKIPPMSIILRMQLLRSALFLASSLPAVLLWTKSRGKLILALGIAHAVMVGIYGLIQASFLPMVLRVSHSLEITADSFAYAAVLALLFLPGARAMQMRDQAAAAASH